MAALWDAGETNLTNAREVEAKGNLHLVTGSPDLALVRTEFRRSERLVD